MNRRLDLSVQYTAGRDNLPSRKEILAWARAALTSEGESRHRGGKIVVRFVLEKESHKLNLDYRGRDDATNVLSFLYEEVPAICGDLVICTPVVEREAATRNKALHAHYAHLIVHGLLHLQGYDHKPSRKMARVMEDRERSILQSLGFSDPYQQVEKRD